MEEQGAGFAPAFLRDCQPALFTNEGLARDWAFIAMCYPCFILTNKFLRQVGIGLAIMPDVFGAIIPDTGTDAYSPCKPYPLHTARRNTLPRIVGESLIETSLDAMYFTHERIIPCNKIIS